MIADQEKSQIYTAEARRRGENRGKGLPLIHTDDTDREDRVIW
jgi:hypothetical protein